MINILDKSKCCGCSACATICPKDAISMVEDEKGFKYPKVDMDKCINCGICDKVCPIIANKEIGITPEAYACYNKNEKIRMQSSSGGIFTLLAERIIKNGGIVFGAMFTEEFGLVHNFVDNISDLAKLRTSKYFQSQINNSYKNVEKFLKQGKLVLFTGTPCQIEGLLTYLKHDYENLYTQDIICHGVPSPKVWNKYMNYRKQIDGMEPQKISFRDKKNGWSAFSMSFKYKKEEYNMHHNNDLFMKAFLNNVCLRDSCYNCSFKKKNRLSDITLADFWGLKNVKPEMFDDKGVSLVITNSNKGKELFKDLMNDMVCEQVDFEQAISYNKAMTKSVRMNKYREQFFSELDSKEFDKLVSKYVKEENVIKKVLKKIKRKIKVFLK